MSDKGDNLKLHSGSPSGRSRRDLDFYPTPPEVTRALMDYFEFDKMRIWECACGDGSMSTVLESYGHDVIGTDISTGTDYLQTSIECDAIITNPPFNLSAEFIKKALGEADIVAMLLKSQYWHARSRYSLFTHNPPSYVMPLTWRPDFLWKERGGKKGAPTMEVCWSVWIKGDNLTKYQPLIKGTESLQLDLK